MKRKILASLFIIILIATNTAYAEKSKLFVDTSSNDWFMEDLSYLVSLGGISGYPDGSFQPNREISKSEFIKTLISSIGYKNLQNTSSHWASGYIDKALDLKIITKKNLLAIDKAITRYEMAEIISNTLDYKKEIIPQNITQYSYQIKDLQSINDKSLYNSVLITYVKGIISGYPNGNFSGDKQLSRAEASAVIVRVINESSRLKQSIAKDKQFADEVLALVNAERKKEGIQPLESCSVLASIAKLKSQDMSTYKYFDHISPNYGSLFDMLKKKNIHYKAAGENIALGQKTPKHVVDAWMDSPGHRRNILNPSFNRLGVGVYFGDRIYWTQAFTS